MSRYGVVDEPVLAAAFFQANTIKGYRFWDEAGTIANKYTDRFTSVEYGPASTLICGAPRDADEALRELQVSPTVIWLSFQERVPDRTVQQVTSSEVDWIARAAGISDFSRLGLRVTLLWPGNDLDYVNNLVSSRFLHTNDDRWYALGRVDGGSWTAVLSVDPLTVRVAIRAVQNMTTSWSAYMPSAGASTPPPLPPHRRLPDYAVALDVDLADSHHATLLDIKSHLSRSFQFLQEKLVPFVSAILRDGA